MHFYDFITTQLEVQPDKDVQRVIDLFKKDKDFPKHTSDPAQLAIYLYLKLNNKQTAAYQKLLVLYNNIVQPNFFPPLTTAREDMFLDALNIIVYLQNNDSRYKF